MIRCLIFSFENDKTLLSQGYEFDEITFDNPEPEDFFDKPVVFVSGTISYKGDVSYG